MAPAAAAPARRITSIDTFRGFTILSMLFVNQVAVVEHVPAWLGHTPEHGNGLTVADTVLPAFMLIFGMAIPLALDAGARRGRSIRSTVARILFRSLALIMMGAWMVYREGPFEPLRVGMTHAVWSLWMFAGFFLLWYRYPTVIAGSRRPKFVLRATGLLLLGWLAVRYHDGVGLESWLPEWPGILGMIGWCYLYASLIYLASRREGIGWVAAVALTLPLAWHALVSWLHPAWLDDNVDVMLNLAIPLVGAYVSDRLFVHAPPGESTIRKAAWLLAIIGVCVLAGWLALPYGVSKIDMTPSYTLFSLVVNLGTFLVFLILDALPDSWCVRWLTPIGLYPLTAYLFGEMIYDALNVAGLERVLAPLWSGWSGVAWSVVFTGVLVLILRLVTLRLKIRLEV